jgi:hypothetical protein
VLFFAHVDTSLGPNTYQILTQIEEIFYRQTMAIVADSMVDELPSREIIH